VNHQAHIPNGRIDYCAGDVQNQVAIESENIMSGESNENRVSAN
jgi:hypothetical protein